MMDDRDRDRDRDRDICRSCQAPIWWTLTKNGKRMPMNVEVTTGAKLEVTHYATCPQSRAWKGRPR